MQVVVDIVSGLYHFAAGAMHLVILGIVIMIGMTILAMLTSRLRGQAKKQGSKQGFFHVHDDSRFDRSTSFKCRFSVGALEVDPADAPGGEGGLPEALCGTEKPIAVIKFDGDKMAAGRKGFAKLIDEVLVNKEKFGGCVVVVASPGGGVAEYGHMYSQMERVRNAGIYLTVCVDTYAASGGYLMSLPANHIVAAPLSMVGSIGVVSEFLNFHDFLVALGINPITVTAGEFKRTLTPFSEVTPEATEKFRAQLVAIHKLFSALVVKWRGEGKVDPAKVCNGDHWTAAESVEQNLGLVDEISSSEAFLFKLNTERDLVYLETKNNPFEKGLLRLLTNLSDHVMVRIWERVAGRMM